MLNFQTEAKKCSPVSYCPNKSTNMTILVSYATHI
ncbi:hypothetical protein E2C01_102582 [Portunus trituberculatus]|uniref:Uncharacterized protein n=1 Tax=Portunus trituberculatus TaxID=210409 RepID=A0A5B7KPH6_PORTR|nr:hypothetical protein [Portunus trituberculatus]